MDNIQKKEAAAAWLLLLLWACVIAFLTLIPEEDIPKITLTHLDKVLHLLEFFALGFLAMNALIRSHIHDNLGLLIILTIIMGSLYAALGEWLQNFVSGRSPDVYDLLSDLIGLNLGVFMYMRGVRDWHS